MGNFFSKLFTFGFSVLNFVFLTTSLSVTLLNFVKTIEKILNLPTSKSSTFDFELFISGGTITNLWMFSLSTLAVKAIKFSLAANSDVSTPLAFANSFLVA